SRLACRRPASGSARFANVTVRHMSKDYPSTRDGADVLAAPARRPETPGGGGEPGLVVEDVETGWCGAVLRTEKSGGMHVVVLEDRHGRTRTFTLGPGFWIDGRPGRLGGRRARAA